MVGRVEKTTDGQEIFYPHSCEYCQLDSGGNHAYNCPYRTGIYPDYDDKITYDLVFKPIGTSQRQLW